MGTNGLKKVTRSNAETPVLLFLLLSCLNPLLPNVPQRERLAKILILI